ncbi:hypothetical protein [Oceanobacillus saliphilus]|uniref:hypothetical protein n=1 Tax=Oceanobacillus saliphilus TaxID=2925834 RepID=UPI00201D42D3|nr:hypothetical protein [Oceanobacillus saliphilus]
MSGGKKVLHEVKDSIWAELPSLVLIFKAAMKVISSASSPSFDLHNSDEDHFQRFLTVF